MDDTQIITARCHAQQAASNAAAAYWSRENREFLVGHLHDDFRRLADALGYDVTPRAEPPAIAAE